MKLDVGTDDNNSDRGVLASYPDGTLQTMAVTPNMNVAQLFMDVCEKMYFIPSNYAYQVYSSQFPLCEAIACNGFDKLSDLGIRYIRLIPRIFIQEVNHSITSLHSKHTENIKISVINKMTGVAMNVSIDIDTTVEQLTLKACQFFKVKPVENYRLLHPTRPDDIALVLHYPFMVYGLTYVILNGRRLIKKCRRVIKQIFKRKQKTTTLQEHNSPQVTTQESQKQDIDLANESTTNPREFTNLSTVLLTKKKKRAPSPPQPSVSSILSSTNEKTNELDNSVEDNLESMVKEFERIKSRVPMEGSPVVYEEYTYTPNIMHPSNDPEQLSGVPSLTTSNHEAAEFDIPRYSSTDTTELSKSQHDSLTGVLDILTRQTSPDVINEYRKKHVESSTESRNSTELADSFIQPTLERKSVKDVARTFDEGVNGTSTLRSELTREVPDNIITDINELAQTLESPCFSHPELVEEPEEPEAGQVTAREFEEPEVGQVTARKFEEPEVGQVTARKFEEPEVGQVIAREFEESEVGQVTARKFEEESHSLSLKKDSLFKFIMPKPYHKSINS